jgi:hypothetical protein
MSLISDLNNFIFTILIVYRYSTLVYDYLLVISSKPILNSDVPRNVQSSTQTHASRHQQQQKLVDNVINKVIKNVKIMHELNINYYETEFSFTIHV